MRRRSDYLLGRLVALQRGVDRILSPGGRRLFSTLGLLVTFVVVTADRLLGAASQGTIAIDLRIYRAAADVALHGGDPWSASVGGFTFAGPPPTLLPYIPAALVPESVAVLVYGSIAVAAAVIALRAVRLPLWWLLFPPISDSILLINPDIVVVALLVATPRLASLSVVLKVYALVPLALSGRWRAMAGGIGLCLLSLPWWPAFLTGREAITEALATQSYGGGSAWGTWMMVPTILALVVLWRRGAEWLTVPALWPYTQLHYSVLALPVAAKSAPVAFLLCFPVAFLAPLAAIVYAVQVVLKKRLDDYVAGAVQIEPVSPEAT